jgi:DNA-binding transcriptional LysR family regulator
MLPDLHRMAVFAKVIEQGSFSGAAAALGLGKSVVSQHVAVLERALGVQLINRSTRSLALTEDGRGFYLHCRQMIDVAEGAVAEVDAHKASPAGTVRLTASYNLGLSFVVACLARFRAAHPEVKIDLTLDDAQINLIDEGFDLALRVGHLSDTALHAVTLASCRMVLCASPAYLAVATLLKSPDDLVHHPWVSITQLPHPDRVSLLARDGRRRTVRVHPAIKTNTGIAARLFLLEGVGIGLLPDYAVTSDGLVELLPDWREASDRPISAIYPRGVHMPIKIRLLIDFFKTEFRHHYRGHVISSN